MSYLGLKRLHATDYYELHTDKMVKWHSIYLLPCFGFFFMALYSCPLAR